MPDNSLKFAIRSAFYDFPFSQVSVN
jgi:hypothetical protein